MPASGWLWNWRHTLVWDGRRPPEFAGQVTDSAFRLQYLSPILGMSARPIVSGEMLARDSGTEVRVRLRALGHEWAMLLLVGFSLLTEIWQSGLGVEQLTFVVLLGLVLGAWWLAGVGRARAVLRRVVLGA